MDARRSSKPSDGVRLPGEVLKQFMSWECAGSAREPAKLEDQVRFLAGTLETATPIALKGRCTMSKRNYDEQPSFRDDE